MRQLLVVLALLALSCAAAPALAAGFSVSVKTDKAVYVGIAQIKINGTVSPAPGPNTAAIVVVTNPAGAAVDVEEDAVDPATGNFGQVTVAGGGLACGGTPCWFAGQYTVNATWGGNGGSATAITTFNYVPAPPASVSVSCTPTSLSVGATTKCTASLSGGMGTSANGEFVAFSHVGGAGRVTFPSTATCALSGNSCSLTVTGNSTGEVSIQALYPGDSANPRSTATANVTVTKASTRTVLECTPPNDGGVDQFEVGLSSPCVATVLGSGGSLSGDIVTFSQTGGNGSVTLPKPATCALSMFAGQATCQVTMIGASFGSVTLQAVFGGDSDNMASTGNTTITEAPPPQLTTTTSSSTSNSTSSSSSTTSRTTSRTTTSSSSPGGGSASTTDLLLASIAVVLVILGLMISRRKPAGRPAQHPTPSAGETSGRPAES